MKPLVLGLLGRNISHSKSKEVYQKLLNRDIDYRLFDIQDKKNIPPLEVLFKGLDGLSVTAPYKDYFLPFVKTNTFACEIGGINCIKRDGHHYSGVLTDYNAICVLLDNKIKTFGIACSIILGDGLMSWATQRALRERKMPFEVFSRRETKGFYQLNLKDLFKPGLLIINTCSREYHYKGDVDEKTLFWDYNYDLKGHVNLKETLGTRYFDGMALLYGQAAEALKFWGIDAPSGGHPF